MTFHLFLKKDKEILSVLNNGSIKELKKLQGVGEKRAQLIVDWRNVHGPFQQVNLSQNYPHDTSIGLCPEMFLSNKNGNLLPLIW